MGNIIRITDLSNPALSPYRDLTEHQLRREGGGEGLFIAESKTVVELALAAGYIPRSVLLEESMLRGQARELVCHPLCRDIPIYTGERSVIGSLIGFPPSRTVMALMERKPFPTAKELLADPAVRRVAVAEGIADSTNLGAIIRSAAALGVDAVLLTPDCCDPLLRRAARVSMGTVFQIPVGFFSAWPVEMALLREHGFLTAALALRRDTLFIDDARLKNAPRLALLLGTEGRGLREETLDLVDATVKIPMYHGVDSLNVSAAAALAFWETRWKENG